MNQSSELQLIACAPPAFSTSTACDIAAVHYGLRVTATPLVSERDQNFRLEADDGRRWVLKIANAMEDPQVTDFQIRALQHIARQPPAGLAVPEVQPTLQGADRLKLPHGDNTVTARLVSFLPGMPADCATLSAGLARNAGAGLARLAMSLAGFEHPGSSQPLLWDMQQARALCELLPMIRDDETRALVAACLDDFAERALPAFPALRAQVIHNDLNPANMLLDPDCPERLAGIIDFGDMQHAPLVVDLGVAASYLRAPDGDPLAWVAEFVAGYHAVMPLLGEEIDLLYDLVNTRLATTVVMLAWRHAERAEDDSYLGAAAEQERSALPFLRQVRAIPRADAAQCLRRACERPRR